MKYLYAITLVTLSSFIAGFVERYPSSIQSISEIEFPSPPPYQKPDSLSKRKIKVMVIDTGVAPHYMLRQYLNAEWSSDEFNYPNDDGSNISTAKDHGTHVAGIILLGDQQKKIEPVCGEVELYSCRFYNPLALGSDNIKSTVTCLKKALRLDVDFLNYSAGGKDSSEEEKEIIKTISSSGTKIIVAAGNESSSYEITPYYPAGYFQDPTIENLIPVGNLTDKGERLASSSFTGGIIFDYGTKIKSTLKMRSLGFMTGTSQAAAMYTHRLIMRKCGQIKIEEKALKELQK